MSGITHRIANKRTYTFNLAASNSQTIVLHRGLDVSMYREATIAVAVHAATADSTHTIQVLAVPVVLTEDEPQTDFLSGTAAATVTINVNQSGTLLLGAASANFGPMLQIQIKGTQPAGTATLTCTVTIDISLKE